MTARTLASRLLGVSMLALMLALAGCYGRVRGGGETTVNVPVHYGMVLEAAKDGQFILDGATLSPDDLGGHFRYLKDQKQLPKTVLLKDGPDQKVKNAHLEYFASLQLSFHFTGYVEHKGKLQVLSAVQDKSEPASADSSGQ
ncbi:MAG TPA: hypothetical protein VFH71_05885 [Rhodanobacteraceae bacterium]|nr:hypothetical protein [Rhodanobacteraceae bacterium]